MKRTKKEEIIVRSTQIKNSRDYEITNEVSELVSADYLDVLELEKFDEHRFECDAVVIELEERHQRVEQSRARSKLDGCYVQREHELRTITMCDALPLSVPELSRYLVTDHFSFQQHTEQRQTCVRAHTKVRVDCTDASLIEVCHAAELEV